MAKGKGGSGKSPDDAAQNGGGSAMSDALTAHDVEVLIEKYLPSGWLADAVDRICKDTSFKGVVTDIAAIKTAVEGIRTTVDDLADHVAAFPAPLTPAEEARAKLNQWEGELDALLAGLLAAQPTTTVATAISACTASKDNLAKHDLVKLTALHTTGKLQEEVEKLKAEFENAKQLATAALAGGPVVVTPGPPRRTATTAAEAAELATTWLGLVKGARAEVFPAAASATGARKDQLTNIVSNCDVVTTDLTKYARDAAVMTTAQLAERTGQVVFESEALVLSAYRAVKKPPPPL